MSDDKSPEDFAHYLAKLGLAATRKGPADGRIYFIVESYVVPHGQNEGKRVTIAFPIPQDYPSTAPYGIHLKVPNDITGNLTSIQGSQLGGDWRFWSRRIGDWSVGRRNARWYMDHVNRWLEAA